MKFKVVENKQFSLLVFLKFGVLYGFLGVFLIFGISGCKKKDRLSASTFFFQITPPVAQVRLGDTKVFSIQSSVPSSPTWTVSPSTIASLNTSIGNAVTMTPSALGDARLQAEFDGVVATAQIAIVSAFTPGVSGIFDVYSDNGLPLASDGFNSGVDDQGGLTLAENTAGIEYTPEGVKFFRSTVNTATGLWFISLDITNGVITRDMTGLSTIRFAIKLHRVLVGSEGLQLEIEDNTALSPGITTSHGINFSSTEWQEISVPLGNFAPSQDLTQILVPFAITATNIASTLTFDVDAIRWE